LGAENSFEIALLPEISMTRPEFTALRYEPCKSSSVTACALTENVERKMHPKKAGIVFFMIEFPGF
jgi:hypothetical protein